MLRHRRQFLAGSTAGLALAALPAHGDTPQKDTPLLESVLAQPVLSLASLRQPLKIQSMELLSDGSEFLVRVRTHDGGEGMAVANSARLREFYPTFLRRVQPFFLGKDARQLETLLGELYRTGSNYKLQGLAFWVCQAAAEMAILDLLGQASGKSIGELFGGVLRRDIPVYRASGNRGNTPAAEIEHLRRLVEEIDAQAIKFRLGGRMSNNRDSLPGRSETLIPLVREEFGDTMALYADANSSYDVDHAVRMGRLMEDHDYEFFEEPCPFDHLWETKQVADQLAIPVAGGEQEFSLRRFRWAIEQRVMDVVQPDLHYFGGFIRSTKVARMAEAVGLPCTVHMSGAGLGYLYVLHFASYVKNPGKHQEFKGTHAIPIECATSSLRCRQGVMRVPSGPGFGIRIDPAFVQKCRPVE